MFISAVLAANGQQPMAAAKLPKQVFHWNPDDSQELSRKDSLRLSKVLSPADRTALIDAIVSDLKSGGADPHSKQQWRAIALDSVIKVVDLNGDGVPEVVVQTVGEESGCSATGNCPIWVFGRSGSGYREILEGDAIQTFTIQHTRTKGYLDLVLGRHASAFEEELFLYRFSDGGYFRTACYDASWKRLVKDEWQDVKNPIITSCGE